MKRSHFILAAFVALGIGAMASLAQSPQSGPGELGLPGVTVFGAPPGPNFLPLSTSNQTAQWFGLGAGLGVVGNQIVATPGGGGTVTAVNPGIGITITGPATTPLVNLTTPVLVANGGTQCGVPTLVSGLPGVPTQGQTCSVTDATTCTAGTAAVGGGSTKCAFTWCGSSWLPANCATSAATGGVTAVNATAPITSSGGTTPTVALNVGAGLSVSSNNLILSIPVPVASGGTNATAAGATAANNIGAAALGANSDITSLLGLTTPLAVSEGGTGVLTASANMVFAGPSSGSTAPPGFRKLAPIDIPGVTIMLANASTTGTVLNTLTKTTGAPSTLVQAATTDTVGVIGICISGCGTTGNGTVQEAGQPSCVFDGATVAGDFVQISTTVAGDCHDTGAGTYPTTIGEVVGKVLSTNAAGGTYQISLFGPDVVSSSGSGAGTVNNGTANQVGYYAASGTAISGNANFTVTSAGYATVSGLANNCKNTAGVALSGGTVTVSSPASCFTTTSVPLCNDITTPTALVKCTPGSGTLVITLPAGSTGGATDVVGWAIVG